MALLQDSNEELKDAEIESEYSEPEQMVMTPERGRSGNPRSASKDKNSKAGISDSGGGGGGLGGMCCGPRKTASKDIKKSAGSATPGLKTSESSRKAQAVAAAQAGQKRRGSVGFDADLALGSLSIADNEGFADGQKKIRTTCRLKIFVRIILWVIRSRHTAAVRAWLRSPAMQKLNENGVFWLDSAERDLNFKAGRRYLIGCRLMTREIVKKDPAKGEPPFNWVADYVQNLFQHPADEIAKRKGIYVQVEKSSILGTIPYPEVHHLFQGLDYDTVAPLKEFGFSIRKVLNNHCLEWGFQQRAGAGDRKPGFLRNLSARRHPLRALQSGCK